MLQALLCITVVSAGIAGCATKPPGIADTTPLHPTAVIERQIVNNGIKGFFPSEANDKHFVRPDMRRDHTTFKGTGTYSGFLIGTRSSTTIWRIDRNLQWSLDTEKSEYRECPLKGCVEPSQKPPIQNATAKPLEAQHESGCTMSIASNHFTVKPTGQKRSINGFDTNEYQIAWVINLRDKASRNTTSTLNIDVWTTPLTAAMRETLDIEERYEMAFSGATSDMSKPQILPAEAAKLISAYLANSLNASARSAFFDAGKQMGKIRGYPISIQLTWDMDGNACAPKEPKAKDGSNSNTSIPTSASGMVSGLAGMFTKKKTDEAIKAAEREPIFSFTSEVKSLKIEPLHDSVFNVPSSYRLVTQP